MKRQDTAALAMGAICMFGMLMVMVLYVRSIPELHRALTCWMMILSAGLAAAGVVLLGRILWNFRPTFIIARMKSAGEGNEDDDE